MQPSYTSSLLHRNVLKTRLSFEIIKAFISNLFSENKSLAEATTSPNARIGYVKVKFFKLLKYFIKNFTSVWFDPVTGMQLCEINNCIKWLLRNHHFYLWGKTIPNMPFHAILLDNFRCNPLFRGLISVPKANRLNMERSARGSAQMLDCCGSAPAASTSQLRDWTVGQTTTTSLQKKIFL